EHLWWPRGHRGGPRPRPRARGARAPRVPRRRLRPRPAAALPGDARPRVRGLRRRAGLLPDLAGVPLQPDGVRDDGDEAPVPPRAHAPRAPGRAPARLRLRHRLRRADAPGGRLPGRVRRLRQPERRVPPLAPVQAGARGAGPRPRPGCARRVRRRLRVRRDRARRGPLRVPRGAGAQGADRGRQPAGAGARRPGDPPRAADRPAGPPRGRAAPALVPPLPRPLPPARLLAHPPLGGRAGDVAPAGRARAGAGALTGRRPGAGGSASPLVRSGNRRTIAPDPLLSANGAAPRGVGAPQSNGGDSMSARSVRLAGALVGAVAAVIAVPSAASAALTPTTLEAQPYLLKFNDVNLQAWVPIRPSAFLYQSSPKVPLAGQVVEFFAGGKGLCAVKTDVNGYAECPGPVRVLFPTLNFGYTAKFPGTSVYAPSSDKGPIIKLGSVSIPG